jgi:hypothetical protein
MAAVSRARKYRKTSWENKNHPECEHYGRYFLVGKTRAGKTTLMVEMVIRHLSRPTNNVNYPRFDCVIIVSPTAARDPSVQPLWKYLEKNKIPTKLYESFTKESAHADMVKTVEANRDRGLKTILVIDDQLGNNTFTKRVDSDSWYNHFTADLSHLYCEMIFNTQVIGGLASAARKNQEVFVFFADFAQRKDMWECCQFVDCSGFNQLMDTYANDRGHALWINAQYGMIGVYHRDNRGALYPVDRIPV